MANYDERFCRKCNASTPHNFTDNSKNIFAKTCTICNSTTVNEDKKRPRILRIIDENWFLRFKVRQYEKLLKVYRNSSELLNDFEKMVEEYAKHFIKPEEHSQFLKDINEVIIRYKNPA